MPAAARENLSKAYNDLSAVMKADKPAFDKGKDVIVYVQASRPLRD